MYNTILTSFGILDRKQRRLLVSLVVAGIVAAFLEVFSVGLIYPVVSIYLDAGTSESGQNTIGLASLARIFARPGFEHLLPVIFLGTMAAKIIFLGYYNFLQTRIAFSIQYAISARVFSGALRTTPTRSSRTSSDVLGLLINDVNVSCFYVVLPLTYLVSELIICVIVGVFLLYVSWSGLLVFGLFFLPLVPANRFLGSRLRFWGDVRQKIESNRITVIQDTVGAAKEIQIYSRESMFERIYDDVNQRIVRAGQLQSFFQTLPRLSIEVCATLGIFGMVASMVAMGHSKQEILAIVTVFLAAAFRMIPSLNRIYANAQLITFGIPSFQNVVRRLQEKKVHDEKEKSLEGVCRFDGTLRAHQLFFKYPGSNHTVIKNCNFSFSKGDVVALVGPSGSGKSTLIDLLIGFFQPDSGHFLIDDRPAKLGCSDWINNFAYVPQKIFILNSSILRNITFGKDDECPNIPKVEEVIRIVGLDDIVRRLPEQLSALVGEDGASLSGGQRQRLGIARALYSDASIIVMDEPTNALDYDSERRILSDIKKLGKTVILVTHNEDNLSLCTKIIRLNADML